MRNVLFALIFGSISVNCLGGNLITSFIEINDVKRKAILYIPNHYDGSNAYPLVVNAHGFSWNATNWIAERSTYNKIADRDSFIVVYPEGLMGSAFGNSWNVGYGPARGVNDVGFIKALIDFCKENYVINEEKIYMSGFSQGGMLTYHFACKYPGILAAIASGSGSLTERVIIDCANVDPIPVMHIHGDRDEVVFYNGLRNILRSAEETVSFWLEKNHCSNESTELSIPNTYTDGTFAKRYEYTNCINKNNMVVFIKVFGGLHDWYSPRSGPLNDVDNSEVTWQFFKQFPKQDSSILTSNIENLINKIKIYPNPTTGYIQILNNNETITQVELLDLTGKKVLALLNLNGNYIKLDNVKKGMYFLKIKTKAKYLSIPVVIK